MCILASFAFCSSFTDCFIVFSCQIWHVCELLMFCRLLSVPLPRFWCVLLCFACGFAWLFFHDLCSVCVHAFTGFVDCVAHFVIHFVRVHFALYLSHYQKITYLFCPVLLTPYLFSCLFVIFVYKSCATHPLCPLSWSKWSPPLIIIIVVNMTHFKPQSCIEKMSFTTDHVSFGLVFDTHHCHMSCCTHLHASAHIYLHTFVSIFVNSPTTSCPGKFSRPSGPN